MKDEIYESLFDENVEDERRLADFVINGTYATFAGIWAVFQSNFAKDSRSLIISAFFCGGVLLIRGIRLFLNVKHNREILFNEEKYEDGASEHTCFGKVSDFLSHFDLMFFGAAVLFFLSGVISIGINILSSSVIN